MSATVSLLSYGVGNLGSVRNMYRRIGVTVADAEQPEQIADAVRVLLPGVGAFDHGMSRLREAGWVDALTAHVASGKPLLGICLGMQLLLDGSDEGELDGLGFIPGRCRKFDASGGLRVPHMGWNRAVVARRHPIFTDLDEDSRFYFVHSYRADQLADANVLSTTDYGGLFASAIVHENVVGVQFHPEKSHHFGMKLLENFSRS